LRWVTVDEARRLQNAAGPDLRSLVAAGLNTGCRAGELLALKAGDSTGAQRHCSLPTARAVGRAACR